MCERSVLKRVAVDQHKARLAARLATMWAGVLAVSLCVLTQSDALRMSLLGAATSLLLTALEAKNLTDEIDKLDAMADTRTEGPDRTVTHGHCAAPHQPGSAPAREGQPRRSAPAAEQGRPPVLRAGSGMRRAGKLASGLVREERFSWVGLGGLTRHQLPSSPLPPIDELQVASFA